MTDSITISRADLKDLIKEAVREELRDVGLRTDEPEHVDEAREDFRFVRRFRKAFEGAASKIGGAVLLSIVGGALLLLATGLKTFYGR